MIEFLRMYHKRIFLVGLLLVISGSFCALTLTIVLAQGTTSQQLPAVEGATISPPLKEITLSPGAQAEEKILVTNPTENLLELYPTVMNFEAGGENGEPGFYSSYEEGRKFSLAHWIVLSQSKIAIAPKQVVEYKYKIEVPQDAEPGGHYGVVFFATQPPEPSKDVSQVSLASMVGSLILVRVPGDIKEEAVLEEFSAPWFFFKPPVTFQTYIRNLGNVHFKPRGEIVIKSWRGKEMERVILNEKGGNILPESRRKFDTKWNAPEKPFWKIPVGRFSADLRVVYGQSERTLGSRVYFWIVPWWIIILILAILLVIIIFIIRYRRRKMKKSEIQRNPPNNNLSGFSHRFPPRKAGNLPQRPRRYV